MLNQKIWDERLKKFIHWADVGHMVELPQACLVEDESGQRHMVFKQGAPLDVFVAGGAIYSAGREWYTFDDDAREYGTFDEAIAAAFGHWRVFRKSSSLYAGTVHVQDGPDIVECPVDASGRFVYHGKVHEVGVDFSAAK